MMMTVMMVDSTLCINKLCIVTVDNGAIDPRYLSVVTSTILLDINIVGS